MLLLYFFSSSFPGVCQIELIVLYKCLVVLAIIFYFFMMGGKELIFGCVLILEWRAIILLVSLFWIFDDSISSLLPLKLVLLVFWMVMHNE